MGKQMKNLLLKIYKEVTIAAKEGPYLYFEPFVLLYKWITGKIDGSGRPIKH
jgi:hypothetical protein